MAISNINIKSINREIVKSETATLRIPEIEFEIPPLAQPASLNTIEGFIRKSVEHLSMLQPERMAKDPETAAKLQIFIYKLNSYADGNIPFTVIVDDPAGNSFIENPCAPQTDPNLEVRYYKRNAEQNKLLGLPEEDSPDEVSALPCVCSECGYPGVIKTILTNIPHFKDMLLMAFRCESCGYKSNEVKNGGEIPPKGRRITLSVESPDDLNRDLLKSETAGVKIPEIELELVEGTLGGKFTTVEGLITDIIKVFKKNPFIFGDSSEENKRENFTNWIERLIELKSIKKKFTIILEDPLANSYIQNPYAPDPDPQLVVEEYERSAETDEEFGITALKELDIKEKEEAKLEI